MKFKYLLAASVAGLTTAAVMAPTSAIAQQITSGIEGTVADADGNLVAVGSIDLGVGMPTLPTLIDKLLVVGGSKGTLGSILMNPQGGSARRTSWREILRD